MVNNRTLLALTALWIGSGAAGAEAQPTGLMYGSDTLKKVTVQALTDCADPSKNKGTLLTPGDITYEGTGSGQGGKAMGPLGDPAADPPIVPFNQQLAPQSRFLNPTECTAISTTQKGNGIVIGLDGIAIAASSIPNTCDTLKYTGTSVAGFTFSDWRDVLRVVYTGQLSKVVDTGTNGCSLADPVVAGTASCLSDATFDNGPPVGVVPDTRGVPSGSPTTRCDNPVRRALLASWPAMFKDTCTNGTCTMLRHAWRRDDVSGTTDTFLTLLGLPKPGPASALAVRTFCNGLDTEDWDPIRKPCDPNEDVCATIPYANRNTNPCPGNPVTNPPSAPLAMRTGQVASNPPVRGGDLGIVQAITLPTESAKQYGVPCTFGKFAFAAMPSAGTLEAQRCPDGTARLGGRCKAPFSGTAQPPIGKFNCFAIASTVPSPRTWTNMDGRAYNLIPRDPDTGTILIAASAQGVLDPRWGGGGVYRIHQAHKMPNADAAASLCTMADATEQIGCLVGADPCSIGYAGQEALKQPVTKGLKLRTPSSDPNQAEVGASTADNLAILKLLNACSTDATSFGTRYALSRRLFINSSKGLAKVNNGPTAGGVKNEAAFLSCVKDRSNMIIDSAIAANGFIPVPGRCVNGTCPMPIPPLPEQSCQ